MKVIAVFLNIVFLWGIFGCNTTSKETGNRQGADLSSRRCYELTPDDCYRAPQCRYDAVSYSCMDSVQQPGSYGYQSNCTYYSSEYDCPRATCRWTGYSCVDLYNNQSNQTNSQCQYYNNDPTSCQSRGCLYQNGMCQANPNAPYQGQSPGVNCYQLVQPNTCAATPGCQWLGNQCQNRY